MKSLLYKLIIRLVLYLLNTYLQHLFSIGRVSTCFKIVSAVVHRFKLILKLFIFVLRNLKLIIFAAVFILLYFLQSLYSIFYLFFQIFQLLYFKYWNSFHLLLVKLGFIHRFSCWVLSEDFLFFIHIWGVICTKY